MQLLLGYLPHDRGMWFSELSKKRSEYETFKAELLINPVGEVSFLNPVHLFSFFIMFF